MQKNEKEDLIKAWTESSKEDLETAKSLFTLKRYMGSLFFCHLSLEKMLKAIYITVNDRYPPPIHKLAKLAKDSRIPLTEKQIDLLNEITTFNIEARYDIFKERLYKKASRQFTEKYIKITEEFIKIFREYLK